MNKKIFLFPAFVLKYIGSEVELLKTNNIDLNEKLNHLSDLTGVNVVDYDIKNNNFLDDEIRNQLITYLISCLYADILKTRSIFPKYIAALSMGLYSALYCAGSVSYHDGALLIKRIFDFIYKQTRDKKYKMLAVTGLSKDDIEEINNKNNLSCEVVIKNNNLSYIITGEDFQIRKFYDIANEEGAFHLNLFPVSIPYHSKHIETTGFSEEVFRDISFKPPGCGIISSVDQKLLSVDKEVSDEIINNLTQPVNWHKTMKSLISLGEQEFIECGPGDSLKRISKFIEGDHKIISLSKLL